jgi:hypothetical protein
MEPGTKDVPSAIIYSFWKEKNHVVNSTDKVYTEADMMEAYKRGYRESMACAKGKINVALEAIDIYTEAWFKNLDS